LLVCLRAGAGAGPRQFRPSSVSANWSALLLIVGSANTVEHYLEREIVRQSGADAPAPVAGRSMRPAARSGADPVRSILFLVPILALAQTALTAARRLPLSVRRGDTPERHRSVLALCSWVQPCACTGSVGSRASMLSSNLWIGRWLGVVFFWNDPHFRAISYVPSSTTLAPQG